MHLKFPIIIGLAMASASSGWPQQQDGPGRTEPLYRVTVIERTVKAVNYKYRSGPTEIDFRGTVLLPEAKGEATVESKAGRTEIDARFEHVLPATRYGREYLTYVLWAITPEGHAKNLGEVLPGSSDHAKLRVTTDLQSFGLLMTAEPYAAVRQPSDVVVMENEVRPDTMGQIEQIQAKYELLPRGHYTYDVSADLRKGVAQGERLPMDQYESLLEVYEAQNAVQIARSMGADRYAPDTFSKAEGLLRTAQDFQIRRADRSTVVTAARQAAQTAEDARAITVRRKQDEQLAQSQEQVAREQELRAKAEAEAQTARSQASADRMQLEEERSSRQRAEAEAAARALPPPARVQTQTVVHVGSASRMDTDKADLRVRLLQDLNAALPALDTPRGLVITLPDTDFRGAGLNPAVYGGLLRIAAIVSAHPGLYVQVDGHTDDAGSPPRAEQFSYERAAAVREELARAGVPANSMSARGLGSSRPLVSNATASGRAQNRRVEITISGDPIGSLPYWDKTYPVIPQR